MISWITDRRLDVSSHLWTPDKYRCEEKMRASTLQAEYQPKFGDPTYDKMFEAFKEVDKAEASEEFWGVEETSRASTSVRR